jgi:pyruvate formate-lyase/glycerol dehydratase family glycyl radical enzyme
MMMNQRIEKLKAGLIVENYPVCLEKGRLITESYRETEAEPPIMKQAKAQANILDKITIFIEEGELIVGNTASKPMGVEVAWCEAIWPQEDIDVLKREGWVISEEDEAEIRRMNEYWKSRTLAYRAGQLFDEERLWPFVQSGVTLPPWKNKEVGWGGFGGGGMGIGPNLSLLAVDYEKVLHGGLNKIIEEAEQELRNVRIVNADSIKKVYFLRAVIIAHKALIRFANRFATLATELASKEADPLRKRELERIASTCRRVPASPARDFYEAVQSFWFIFLMLNPNPTVSLGRFDQYMYPFYKKDIEEKRITDDEVLELMECLRIKDMGITFTASRTQQREKNAGLAKWHNMIIGGQTPGGKDATNELSYLILEAAKRCPTPHHTITVRVHEGTPLDFMVKALEVVKTGMGMPAFVGDKSYLDYLLGQGVPLETARDYVLVGCLDAGLPGQTRVNAYMMFIVPIVFEFFLNNGVEPRTGRQLGPRTGDLENFKSFDDLMRAFKEQLAYFMGLVAEWDNIFARSRADSWPYPFESSLMVDAIKEGKGMCDRVFPFENGAALNAVGMINVADSLAAIKKLVFEEKKVTMKELKTALDKNWQGYEGIQKLCLEAPKYGNDDNDVDSIAKELYKFWADTAVTLDSALGGKHKPAAISISAQWPGGALTGATPDGRFAGECLVDGTMSAMRGRDTHGPTALLKSAMKIDQRTYQATLLNMKFHPSALKSTEDLKKLSGLIKTYFRFGGKHIQFNVVNRETLLDAQRHPENYRDLVVRVAGYSAYFIQLGKAIQDEIIGRTEYRGTA